VVNWVSSPLSFSLSTSAAATYIFSIPTCTTTIITLEPCALNVEFQHFILNFNKVSLLCGYLTPSMWGIPQNVFLYCLTPSRWSIPPNVCILPNTLNVGHSSHNPRKPRDAHFKNAPLLRLYPTRNLKYVLIIAVFPKRDLHICTIFLLLDVLSIVQANFLLVLISYRLGDSLISFMTGSFPSNPSKELRGPFGHSIWILCRAKPPG
jgi:hypothetical protein